MKRNGSLKNKHLFVRILQTSTPTVSSPPPPMFFSVDARIQTTSGPNHRCRGSAAPTSHHGLREQ